jgi:hypothetical protein
MLDKYSMATIQELESFKMSDAVAFHKELNPCLWEDNKLDPEVRDQLLLIAEDFVEYLGISNLKVKDVTISGSNAAYSYTPHSDLDLHVLVDFNELPNNEVYQELFTAKKTLYNDAHDITVRDVPVELYVQDTNHVQISLGEYSVVYDKWIRIPKKRRANFDEVATKAKYEKLGDLVELALQTKDPKRVKDTIDVVKRYRKAGLEKAGEFGPENLAYKAVRKQGLIQDLYDLKAELHAEKLSIEEGGADTWWAHEDEKITLQDILELTKHIKQINLPINDNLTSKLLHWDGNPEEIERINQVTVSNQFPILVMLDGQGQIDWILDGNHRLHKAIKSRAKTIPAKLIKPSDLNDKAKRIFHIKEQGVSKATDKQAAVLKIQKHLNKKYGANLDLDGKLGPLTLKSINKFMPRAKKGLADEPNKTTAVQGKKVKVSESKNHWQFSKPKKYDREQLHEALEEYFKKDGRWYPHRVHGISSLILQYTTLIESTKGTWVDEVKDFWNRLRRLDHRSKLKLNIGSKVSVLQLFTHAYDSDKVFEFRGNLTPKKIVDMDVDSDNRIETIYFEDGTSFPDRSFIERGQGGELDGIITMFFGSKQDAENVLLVAELTKPEQWKISKKNLQESINDLKSYRNPSPKTLHNLTKRSAHKHMRGMYHNGNTYWWDANDAIHADGSKILGIPYDYLNRLEAAIDNISGNYYVGGDDNVPKEITQRYDVEELAEASERHPYPYGYWIDITGEVVPVETYNGHEAAGRAIMQKYDRKTKKGKIGDSLNLFYSGAIRVVTYNYPDMEIEICEPNRKAARSMVRLLRELQPTKVYYENNCKINGPKSSGTWKEATRWVIQQASEPDYYDKLKQSTIEKQTAASLTEASGYIPSQKEKNDPRWKTALTVDVKPDSIKDNAKAFGFKTSRAGIPPQARADGKIAEDLMREFKTLLGEQQEEMFPGYDEQHREKRLGNWLAKSWGVQNGKPQTFYHATTKDFDTFNTHGTGFASALGMAYEVERHGSFFAVDPKFAEGFIEDPNTGRVKEGGRVLPVHLSIQSPIDLRDDALSRMLSDPETREEFKANDIDLNSIYNHFYELERWELFDGPEGAEFVDNLQKLGFDGAIMNEAIPNNSNAKSGQVWVAFSPNQVKSVYNRGSFSPDDNKLMREDQKNAVPKIGYHVTATKNLPVIRKNGINADRRGNSYVWDSLEMAEWFTDFQNDEGQDRTILKIDMSGIDARPDPEAEDMSDWSSRFKPGTNGGAWIVSGAIPSNKIIG